MEDESAGAAAVQTSAAAHEWLRDWGSPLRTARQVSGLSLTELSARTGLSKGYLSKLESGSASAANPDDLQRFNAGEVFILDMTQPPLDALSNPYGVTTSLVGQAPST